MAFAIFIAALIVLHLLLHIGLGLGAVAPDLITVALLLASRRMNRALAASFGALMGLLRDALALVAFGADMIALALLGYLGARGRELFVGDSWFFVVVYLFVGKWLHDAIFYALTAVVALSGTVDMVPQLLLRSPIEAAYAAAAGVVALALYRGLTGER